ncbi:RHS repeat domain-containing protein [Cellvibrio japonicus]|uniref:Rhs family protein n=1 Tax=Cellvibrio japonicus (strain Ueda107) TaxID=498211 RepID=B3PIF3_CELJU|nr:RHS repeat-associated core domain-containing protein [Cellvibrio japonicus]ACE83005.1 Rhs family protein [Cellvibrio japonicus Ueda107]QEI12554.1 RHS repeat-associated core domain-containing protein [Cellvibrio japonicus]QEI16128.1 RHS repeat-associated core domain-containing protein [Cellvibrio japonicus]QEI19706.1 RHS repeat-associated core domain-containing protein [Cellvibrio japonicus]
MLTKNQKSSLAGALLPIQDVSYEWDVVGNLKSRWNQSSNIGRTARKNLQESFCYDGLNRLIKSYASTLVGSCSLTVANQDVEYDGLGNITRKAGVGNYTYSGKGSHAVTSTTNDGTYTYDNNGNQVGGYGRSIVYSSYDQPTSIAKGTTTTEFNYGPDRSRWQRIDTKGLQKTYTQYLGNVERIEVHGSGIVEWKRYIAGAIYTLRTTATTNGSGISYGIQRTDKSFVYNDHLGSLDVVVNNTGTITHTASFDVWGNRRSAENWSGSFSASSLSLANYTQPITQRGYTGHEMLDDSGLIHMNGRIYDQKTSRFLQADPFIQAASDTQSYNRYSYVRNNPLNATDPSGYFWNFVISAVVTYAVGDYAKRNNIGWLAQLASVAGCVTGNAAICAGAAFGSTYGATGNLGLAFVVGVTAGAMSGMPVGNAAQKAARLVAGAVLGGASSMISGGEFGHGFISAGLGTLAGGRFGSGPGGFVVATVVGGTISDMTGGKFKNGAASAAFAFAMQWAVSSVRENKVAAKWLEYEEKNPAPTNETTQQRLDRIHKGVKELGYTQGAPKDHVLNVRVGDVESRNAAELVDINNVRLNKKFVSSVSDARIAFTLAHEYIHIADMLAAGVTTGAEWEGTLGHFKSEMRAYEWQNNHAAEFGYSKFDVQGHHESIIQCYKQNVRSIEYGSGFTIGC